MELGNLLCGMNGDHQNGRLWLVGMATFQTYMRCKSGHPSLETVWGIHPLTIPSGSLRLSLVTDRYCKLQIDKFLLTLFQKCCIFGTSLLSGGKCANNLLTKFWFFLFFFFLKLMSLSKLPSHFFLFFLFNWMRNMVNNDFSINSDFPFKIT